MTDDTGAKVGAHATEEGTEDVWETANYFSGKFHDAIVALPDDLKLCSEDELIDVARPTAKDWQLRRNLHNKIAESILNNTPITTVSIYEGIVHGQAFFANTIPDPRKVAFITRPIVEHKAFYEAIYQEGLQKILDYIRTNKLSDKNASIFFKFIERAGDRIHGAVAQKMQIQSKNLNVDVTASQLPSSQGSLDIQNRITQLQDKLLDTGGVKDVTPTNDTSEDPS